VRTIGGGGGNSLRTTLEWFGGGTTGKAFARAVLAFVIAIMLAFLALGSPAFDPASTVFAQQSPTTSPTGPTGPAIQLLNPEESYDPAFPLPPRPPGSHDPPKISDKFDGVDSLYHIVAWTNAQATNAVVEAYWVDSLGLETTIGTLQPVSGASNVWELFWDIPSTLAEGNGTLRVQLFQQGPTGLDPVALDEQEAEMRHQGGPTDDPRPAEETVELTWPTQNGPLGFFKGRTGPWRGVIDGFSSTDAQRVRFFYSVQKPGTEPKFKDCGQSRLGAVRPDGSKPIIGANVGTPRGGICSLTGKDLPTQVTAFAVVAIEDDKPAGATTAEFTQDSADVHAVQGYAQDPKKMKVAITPNQYFATSATTPTGKRRTNNVDCLEFIGFVTDDLNRPVRGANLDVHLTGPDDQVAFGVETSDVSGTNAAKPADKGPHNKEDAVYCDDFIDTPQDDRGDPAGDDLQQGDTNRPGAPDEKHIEAIGTGTTNGTADDITGPNEFWFHVFSSGAGFSEITAWVDDARTPQNLADMREVDDDVLGQDESPTTIEAQWMPTALSLGFAPAGQSSTPGTCIPFTVRARAGPQPVPGINIDLHATGPSNDLDFCDPPSGSPRRAPDHADSKHAPEDPGESIHAGAAPEAQHAEGETDDNGNFLIGIISPVTGDTTLEAWVDNEPGQDNDVFDSGEVRSAATINWLASLADAELSFINPSPYGTGTSGGGNGTRVATTRDADTQYHVAVRVDAFGVPAVELFVSTDGTIFRKIGDMTQVGATDLWEFYWNVDVSGSATLRAQIPGTDRREDIAISVNNTSSATARAWETAEILSPIDGSVVAFTTGATEIRGTASAGAEGVELYYTKAPSKDTPQGADWIFCGYIDLSGTGTTPQEFKGNCRLAPADQAALVTGVAAITFDCSPIVLNDGCNGDPAASPARQPGEKESGDAHRVFGFEGSPVVNIEPAESSGKVETCQRIVLSLADQTAQPLGNENVDIHLSGPADDVAFCDVEGGTDLRAPDQGAHTGLNENESTHPEETPDSHHAEAETKPDGEIVFGINSNAAGDTNIFAWRDPNDDDQVGADEANDIALLHWRSPTQGGGKRCDKVGTAGRDVLRGTSGRDVLCGRAGKDRIFGKSGNDVLIGGRGKDLLIGSRGRDTLRAGRGNDVLRAGRGRDTSNGGAGNDRFNGGGGRDVCRGGKGRDRFKDCERRR
jgi:hypothetical protein